MPTPEKPDMRSIGGSIPADLYWKFKEAQAARHESATKALEIAIRLYLEADAEEQNVKEDQHG